MSPPWKWLPAAFASVALSFVLVTVVTQMRSRAIVRAATSIADSAAPSIELLGAARGESRHIHALLREELAELERGGRPNPEAVVAPRQRFDREVADYFLLPAFQGERERWRELLSLKDHLEDDLVRFGEDIARQDAKAARALLDGPLAVDFGRLGDGIARLIELNAEQARELAFEIRRQHDASAYLAGSLDIVCVVLALLAAMLLRRSLRAHNELVEEHRRLDRDRAAELEQFAGRIAHDILSPLGATSFALELAGHADDPSRRARAVDRGRRGLARVQRLVDGLLGFARSGARPSSGARASLDDVITDVEAEVRPSAEALGIELRMEVIVGEVACSEGVLSSLVGNLLRNAIKYIGDPPEKRITVRTLERGERIRVEVTDTGRGLPPDLEPRVFEPYVRGPNDDASGMSIGLGLATVRKLAEAHGGEVGVRSVDAGCTFWFELPKGSPAKTGHQREHDAGSEEQAASLAATSAPAPPPSIARGRLPAASR